MIESLKYVPLEEIGTIEFIKQHSSIEKLNLQAHKSAKSKHDEFIIDLFVTFNESLQLIIKDLITLDVWKRNIYPHLKDHIAHLNSSVKSQLILTHEGTLLNLLEILC
jgi:hypothetical protein